jgi:NADPH:quinone reductase-like Zn-dependent oxidoreductase
LLALEAAVRAAVVDRYGPPEVVTLREVAKPVPGEDEVLVRARATTVNSGDARVRGIHVPGGPAFAFLMRLSLGFNAPKQPIGGFEMAGEVEAVGRNVAAFKPGDRVVGSHGFKFGLHQEQATFGKDDALAHIPDGVSYEDAVAVMFGGTTAEMFFRKCGLKAGDTILINGASGAVGTMAVQLAKYLGAEVTSVCGAANANLVRSLGADEVIVHTEEDFTRNGKTYDFIMDNHGNAPFSRVKGSLKPGGKHLLVIFERLGTFVSAKWNRQVIEVNEADNAFNSEVYVHLLDLTASGAIGAVIDSTFSFEDIAEAHRRVDSGHKVGSVVVTFD